MAPPVTIYAQNGLSGSANNGGNIILMPGTQGSTLPPKPQSGTPGRVGIYNTNPSYTLDVYGNINTSNSLCIAGDCKGAWPTSSGWSLAGNSGTDGTNFIGTTDNIPLNFRVNN